MQYATLQLTPTGVFRPTDGRVFAPGFWVINDTSAPAVLTAFKAKLNRPVIDYEHQTLHKERNGHPAPAAGWMKELQWRSGVGLFVIAELTDRAALSIRAGEYRYVSPVFRYAGDGQVLSVEMAALTNSPALDGLAPIALEPMTTATATAHQSLSPVELAICAATGITPQAFAAARTTAPIALEPMTTATATAHQSLSPVELAICAATGITPQAFAAARTTAPSRTMLSPAELAVCAATGITHEAFAAARATG